MVDATSLTDQGKWFLPEIYARSSIRQPLRASGLINFEAAWLSLIVISLAFHVSVCPVLMARVPSRIVSVNGTA